MTRSVELEARDLSVAYDAAPGTLAALRSIDLTVEPGAFLAVLGPSGSGKTTLLNAFAGLVRPSSGDGSVPRQADRRALGRPRRRLPAPRAPTLAGRCRECRLPAEAPRRRAPPSPDHGRAADRACRPRRVLRAIRVDAVGRHAAARRSGACARRRSRRAPPRRAARRARRDDARGPAAGPSRPLGELREDRSPHHPRHRRGRVPCDPARRPVRAAGQDRGALRPSFSHRVAAGEDPHRIRAEPDFTAIKAELRELMHRRAAAAAVPPEAVS